MAEVMFEVISIIFYYIERLVFYFPFCATAGGGFGDIAGNDGKIGNETVAIGDLAGVGVADFDVEPVDIKGIFAVAQGHLVDPAIAIDETGFARLWVSSWVSS